MDGSAANGPAGIFLHSWTNSVGGPDPADRNVIAGSISVFSSKQNSIVNNYIGTDASGTVALGVDGGVGISTGFPYFAELNSISGNVISGNTGTAVIVGGGDGNSVTGNLIGTDATGTVPLGNEGCGVIVSTDVGNGFGLNTVSGNTIAYNAEDGVNATYIYGANILHNFIHDNGGLGIVTNGTLAPPTISSAITLGSSTTIWGTTDHGQGGSLTVELFSSPACDPSGSGEGAVPLGTISVLLGYTFTAVVPAVTPGSVLTATVTAYGTSEFSICTTVADGGPGLSIDSISPSSGPWYPGGAVFTLAGHGFLPGAVVTAGPTIETITIVNENEIVVTSRGRSPGTLNDVTVTNLDDSTSTLLKGWFSDFLDVAQDDPFHASVESVFRAGITAGCGGGMYCRDAGVRRDQMAVLLLKAQHGPSYVPPGCTGVFADVPCPGPYTDWVEQLHAEGITGGCGDGIYCPDSTVRRDQVAVFLLKTEHSAGYAPPTCAGHFADVPCPSTFADWIEALASEGVTSGCGEGNYCPSNPSTRGQMAVFLSKAFGLP